MPGEVAVVVAATHQEWATRLTGWISDHGSEVRLRDHYVLARDDALAQDYDCLVADADSSLLDAALVAELHRRGRTVVGVCDPDLPHTRRRLTELGCDRVVDKSAPPAELLAAVAEVGRSARDLEGLLAGLVDLPADHPEALPAPPGQHAAQARPRRGRLTAVTGPVDGQGATEVAVELAVAIRRWGRGVVLVDADLSASSLAQRLGVGFDRNLHTAVDAVVHHSGTLPNALTATPVGGFELLAGLPPRKWAEVDAGDLAAVLDELLLMRHHVLCNIAAPVEDLPGDRNAVTRRVLADADRIVLVADATPTGCERACRWLADVADLVDDLARVHVVFNRCRRGDAAAQLEAELRRCAEIGGVTAVPYDPKVVHACWAGEAVAPGRFTRAVGQLADAVVLRQVARRRGLLARVAAQ
ncbi:MAG TPA: hypothetical protein VM324_16230 [Egibacteraceae bacterium]|nr:hypothetical protein [Egibacteraceae bacterium]